MIQGITSHHLLVTKATNMRRMHSSRMKEKDTKYCFASVGWYAFEFEYWNRLIELEGNARWKKRIPRANIRSRIQIHSVYFVAFLGKLWLFLAIFIDCWQTVCLFGLFAACLTHASRLCASISFVVICIAHLYNIKITIELITCTFRSWWRLGRQ